MTRGFASSRAAGFVVVELHATLNVLGDDRELRAVPCGTSLVRTIISAARDGSADPNSVAHTISSLGRSCTKAAEGAGALGPLAARRVVLRVDGLI
jgi:hypothetical protein